MNIPNPFSSGLFDPNVEFRDNFSETPRRTSRKTKTKRKRPTKSTQMTPVIPPPDDENDVIGENPAIDQGPDFQLFVNGEPVTGRQPLKIRLARLIAWAHLILGTIYASTLAFRFGTFLIGEQPSYPFILLPLIALVFIYLLLESVIGAWCDVVNDIMLGIVAYWPEALTLEKFFGQISAEIASDIARSFFRQLGIPEVAAVIPRRPYINSSGQSLLYTATYLWCFFYAPLSAIVKSIFWKVELGFGILYLAYLFTIASNARAQR